MSWKLIDVYYLLKKKKSRVISSLPGELVSGGGLLLDRVGDSSDFFSAVRTDERAATAAALCDPWPLPDGLGAEVLAPGDELNAEFKAARASALCLGPWFDPLDLSWKWDSTRIDQVYECLKHMHVHCHYYHYRQL